MHRLRMLGTIDLSSHDSSNADALLRQPKRLALLAYLAMPLPGTWHRRDSVIAVFWPEQPQASARTALRSTLYGLRRLLPEGAVRTRGDDEVSLDPALVGTDVAEMMADIGGGNHAQALEKYQGDFLAALHIGDAEGFERWLQVERGRLKDLARKEAGKLADALEKAGDTAGAIDAARKAAELDPDDESAARLWIALLDRAGDKAQAFAVYQRFRNHLSEEFGVRPSAETVALVDAVRTRHAAVPPVDAERVGAGPATIAAVGPTPIAAVQPATIGAVEPTTIAAVEPPSPTMAAAAVDHSRRGSRPWKWAALAAPFLALAIWVAARKPGDVSAAAGRRLVVLPMENETGDAKLDYVASGIAEGVAARLEGIGGLIVRSGARSDWPASVRHDYKAIGRDFGATILLKTTLARVLDSLEIRMSVIDAATSGERVVASRRFATSQLNDVEGALAASVAGAVFRVPLPASPRASPYPIDPESYRLTLDGFHQLNDLRNHQAAAKQLFLQATLLDPRNARAWSGLSSVWANEAFNGLVPWDVGYDRSDAAASRALALDSLQAAAWSNLAYLRAMQYESLAVGAELIKKAVAAEPGNPEIFLVKSALLRQAHKWDESLDAIRVARALDPLSARYPDREAFTDLCADRAPAALRVYEAQLAENPGDPLALGGRIRTLARLGRYDEAISSWRVQAAVEGDSAIVRALQNARGRNGYWDAKHVEGKARLGTIGDQMKNSFSASVQAPVAAGDLEGGLRALEQMKDARFRHYLPCAPGLDEVRDTPRFKAIVEKNGPLPER